jgi:subtilisin family serine protease
VTVIAAGNEGQAGLNLGKRLPQSLGSTNNPLITVGGIENDGSLWIDTTPEGNGPSPGSITVSLAANVQCASSTISNGVQTAKGTSFAAPQVAGIAAYFLSLPSLKAQLQQGGMSQVAQNVKNYIVQAAFRRGADSNPLSAYNLAEDAICLAEIPAAKRSLPKRDGPDIETVLADGTLVATDVNVCSPYSSCWINHTKF